MSRSKELSVYAALMCVIITSFCAFQASGVGKPSGLGEVVENPQLTWINDRKPTQADCDNRAGLVWVWNGGKSKIRFYHNVQEGAWWATIKSPMGPKEKWIDRIVEAVEGDHCHVTE